MGRKKTDEGAKTEHRLSAYAKKLLPEQAVIDFIFHEDFNADGLKEAVVGVTRFAPFPPDSAVLLIQQSENRLRHCWLTLPDTPETEGIFDNAEIADTDGDGVPELVLSVARGQEHCITVYVMDWPGTGPVKIWHSSGTTLHGSMVTQDADNDGISEIIIESGTNTGSEIIAMKDSCYHVRESFLYKWNGHDYSRKLHQVRSPYDSFNASVEFIRAIWSRNYKKAFSMVVLPGFLGLSGLDDQSQAAFRRHVGRSIRPMLAHNLEKGKFIPLEPYETCCRFAGTEDIMNVELVRMNGQILVYRIEFNKKIDFDA